ncbi:MAG: hypothetical protein A3D31_01505 [Candidatus Fluviicola riflensis]|nr:MAG: hypothetical protein CHH17_04035 [Candidatus Fluviicola riflensis]OGS76277.1 MAG: hypothetical protein A3D31_01505 [Candidatus Fluviicola riflensis]OGS83179.1 MAG: hypothetical protein A2724_00335 [Fluviicola sp. RIFCSPHIGHO2_01_FULL_43_53]OGS83809.1 MAG: hypothetical protein A3E30_18110 [Fluviicola sp. RIFCSPHIGHO2_12_FULL_43_24]
MIVIAVIVLGVSLYDYFDSKDWQHITCVDRINVVFEDRNKKYGAYSIRRDYNDLILFIVLGIVGLFGIFTMVSFGLSTPVEELTVPVVKMDTTLMTLDAPPEAHVSTLPNPYKIVGGGGSGTPDNSKYDPTPNPMMPTEGIMPSIKPFKPGKGNSDDGKNPNEEASTRETSPFHGTGGKGGGDGKGKGKGLGNDDGDGKGPGFGPGEGGTGIKRTLERRPNAANIDSDENCIVVLKVKVDANGNVVGTPTVIRDKTTTANSVVINEVIRVVKAEAKYNKVKEGTPVFSTAITVNVSAH